MGILLGLRMDCILYICETFPQSSCSLLRLPRVRPHAVDVLSQAVRNVLPYSTSTSVNCPSTSIAPEGFTGLLSAVFHDTDGRIVRPGSSAGRKIPSNPETAS